MDNKSITNSSVPDQATSPEEDATLLAIEALEARSIDPNPKPWNAPRVAPVPPRPVVAPTPTPAPAPAPTPAPKVIGPVIPEITHTPKPAAQATVPAPKLKKPLTPSEKMAEELANAPAPSRFQFFSYKKPPRKSFIIIGIIVVLVGAGVAAYFTFL